MQINPTGGTIKWNQSMAAIHKTQMTVILQTNSHHLLRGGWLIHLSEKYHAPMLGSAFMLERKVKHDIEGNPSIQHRIPA